jgi:hypothetical protein
MTPRNVNLHQQRINVGMTRSMTASESDSSVAVNDATKEALASTSPSMETLPVLFPAMALALARLGYSTPTPIQAASAAEINKNLLLIAPTGSGKTLAYLLPALSNAISSTSAGSNSNVLVVAPTRELAVQLQRDAVGLLDNDASAVALAVRGVPFKMAQTAKVLVGTPAELLEVMQHPTYGQFLSTLSAVVLDEVDVLLPLASKMQRTSLDETAYSKRDASKNNAAENERRKQQEEKQKLAAKKKMLASKRAGAELSADNKQVVVPTEQLLRLIALTVVANTSSESQPAMQVLAGSATASRRTLDRLNRAMRAASAAANTDYERVWSTDVKVCRPPGQDTGIYKDDDDSDDAPSGEIAPVQHTIRAVTVPTQVNHRFISLSKEAALSSDAALSAVAKIANTLKPQRALVFLCGEFAKQPNAAVKKDPATRGRQKGKPKKVFNKPSQDTSSAASMLSARKTCDILGTYGIQAKVSTRRVCDDAGLVRFYLCRWEERLTSVLAMCRVMFSHLCHFLFVIFVKLATACCPGS